MEQLTSWAREHGATFEAAPHPEQPRKMFATKDLTPGGKQQQAQTGQGVCEVAGGAPWPNPAALAIPFTKVQPEWCCMHI